MNALKNPAYCFTHGMEKVFGEGSENGLALKLAQA